MGVGLRLALAVTVPMLATVALASAFASWLSAAARIQDASLATGVRIAVSLATIGAGAAWAAAELSSLAFELWTSVAKL